MPAWPPDKGFSVSCCMSSALSEPGGLGLGTLGFHAEVGFGGGFHRRGGGDVTRP
jgi:hypothetical protein